MPREVPQPTYQMKGTKLTISIDLDTLEAPDKGPFSVTLGKRQYTLVDIRYLDYRQLLAIQDAFRKGDVEPAIQAIVSADDREDFFANRISADKLKLLFEGYNEHYDIVPARTPVRDGS